MVITERQFIQVQRQIFLADMVELPVHGAFHNRPKTLNRVRVDVPVLAAEKITAVNADDTGHCLLPFAIDIRASRNSNGVALAAFPLIVGLFLAFPLWSWKPI